MISPVTKASLSVKSNPSVSSASFGLLHGRAGEGQRLQCNPAPARAALDHHETISGPSPGDGFRGKELAGAGDDLAESGNVEILAEREMRNEGKSLRGAQRGAREIPVKTAKLLYTLTEAEEHDRHHRKKCLHLSQNQRDR